MPSLSRQSTSSTRLLLRILERPELVSAVRELPAPVLGKLIDHVGLEDAGEIVALASTAQLERVFDRDLWHAPAPGEDERFRPERFALWLNVMLESGEEFLVRRLCELPRDLLALAIHRLVLVVDLDALAERFTEASEDQGEIERAIESAPCEEWEEFRLFARDSSHWDIVWFALLSLDRDHHDLLRALLEQCCALSERWIEEEGGLYEVLTSEEMLENDVAAEREDRRAAEGYVSAADARSFLELARRGVELDRRDAITAAYFRALAPVERSHPVPEPAAEPSALAAARGSVNELVDLLEQAEVVGPVRRQPMAALPSGGKKPKSARREAKPSLFRRAMAELERSDAAVFSQRVEELGYLANVMIAGSEQEGRRPRPAEAFERAIEVCGRGLERALGEPASRALELASAVRVLSEQSADRLFRRGFG